MAIILDGNKLSQQIRSELKLELENLIGHQRPPKLSVLLVGDDDASSVYVRNKEKACNDAGILTETFRMQSDSNQKEIIRSKPCTFSKCINKNQGCYLVCSGDGIHILEFHPYWKYMGISSE